MHQALQRVIGLLGLLLVAACQPLPHPLADDAPPSGSAILTPRDGAGIVVQRVAGVAAPVDAGIAEALAEALQESDVPASTQIASKASYVLVGTAEEAPPAGGRVAVALHWELRDHDGAAVGTYQQTIEASLADWRAGQPALLTRLAKNAAPAIAELLQDEGATAVATDEPSIIVRPVTGAPGDGSRTLARAMRAVLRQANLTVAETDKPADAAKAFTIDGTVVMAKPAGGKQKIQVTWSLFDPTGAQIGQVSQENAIAAGSLDGAWGEVAYAVAQAAGGGIVALIDRLKSGRAGS
jgi:hypothetical protein